MKHVIAAVLTVSIVSPSVVLAVDSKGATYYGGTVAAFKDAKDPVEGKLDTKNNDVLLFVAQDKPFTGQRLAIPYD